MDEENNQGNNPLGKDSISHLIELMETNNKSSHEIEKDGRNSRRHLLEIKKTQRVLADMQAKTVFGFENFQEMIDSQSLQNLEDDKERKTVFQEMRDSLKDIADNTSGKGGGDSDGGGGFGSGFMGGLGGALGTVAGIGALGAAIPLFFGGILMGESLIEGAVSDMANIDFATTKKLIGEFNNLVTIISPTTMTLLAAILAAATFSKDPVRSAMGMGVMGAAITAFFGGLMIGETVLDLEVALGGSVNFDSYKKMIASFDDAIGELSVKSGTALVGLLGAGGLIGYVSNDFKGVAKVAAGMGAMGAGIGGFFAGLGAGAAVGSLMTSGFESLPGMVGAFGDSINVLNEKKAGGALTALLATGGVIGAFTAFGTQAKVAAGMGVLGAGISGFFLGFDSLTSLGAAIGVDGSKAKVLISNFADGINAFDTKSLVVLGGLLGAGGMLGPVGSLYAGAGMTALGVGVAGFFAGFETVTGIASFLGADGSNTKKLLGNFADGINKLANLEMGGKEMQEKGKGLTLLAGGMVALLGQEGLYGLKDTIGKVFDFITLGLFKDDRTIFQILIDTLGPLEKLNTKGVDTAATLFTGLGNFLKGVNDSNVKDNIDETTLSMKKFGQTMESVFVTGFDDSRTGNTKALNAIKVDIDKMTASLNRMKDAATMDIIGGGNFQLGFESKDLLIPGMNVTNLSVENAMLKLPESAVGNVTSVVSPTQIDQSNNAVIVQAGTGKMESSLGFSNTTN